MGKGKDRSAFRQRDGDRSDKLGLLDEQTTGYYRRIADTLKGEFETAEEKGLFVSNVFTQLAQEALKVSQNQTVSCIVESLVSLAGRRQLTRILRQFSLDWETACCDRFASFVTQSLILHSNPFLGDVSADEEGVDSKSLEQLLDELYSFLTDQLALYMQHTYASHILRVLLECLAGRRVSEEVVRSRLSRDKGKGITQDKVKLKQPPAQYTAKLLALCQKIAGLKKLDDHIGNSLSSPVIQAVLLTSKTLSSKQHATICQQILENAELFRLKDGADLPENVTHEIGSHVVEQFLCSASDKIFNAAYSTHLTGRLLVMAKHPLANFVLQKLIANLHTVEQFETVFSELSKNLESILATNHVGVIVRIAEACVKHGTKQKKFIKSLWKAFHCYKPAERQSKLVPLLASLSTYEMFYGVKDESMNDGSEGSESDDDNKKAVAAAVDAPVMTSVSYHGSLLLQALLRFSNPRPALDGLLELSSAELRALCTDACGSHVIDAMLGSTTVGERSREQLGAKLKGQLVDLACDKAGSRTIDSLWKAAGVRQKCSIADELLLQEDRLRGNKFGYFVHARCALANYKRRPQEWRELQGGMAKKRKQLEQVINEDSVVENSKKKKKK